MTNLIIPYITPLTRDANGHPCADSRDVAARFGKDHKHVLRDIDALVSHLDKGQSNFGPSSYLAGNGKLERCVTMDRDGFTLLAMGFTGADALKWKLAYIQAFNTMEAELKSLTREDVLVSMGIDRTTATMLVKSSDESKLAIEQSTRALELATIAEAKSQATALACQDYSIMAYSRLCNIPVDLATARNLGVRAGKLSRERGLPVGKARDPRFGSVNTYIESVLQEVFTEGL